MVVVVESILQSQLDGYYHIHLARQQKSPLSEHLSSPLLCCGDGIVVHIIMDIMEYNIGFRILIPQYRLMYHF